MSGPPPPGPWSLPGEGPSAPGQPPMAGQPPPPGYPPPGHPPPGQAWQQWAPGYGFGVPPAPRTSPVAIAALVTACVALVPVAVVTAIVALAKVRRSGERGRGLAWAALGVSGAWVLLGVVVVAVVALLPRLLGPPGALGRVADAGPVVVGDCLQAPDEDRSVGVKVDCAQAHDAEVYRIEELGESVWPGYEGVDGRADFICFDNFRRYVGTSYEDSEYDYGFFAPDEAEWATGERKVVCVVLTDPDHRGSVQHS